jgi:hypothetical protein
MLSCATAASAAGSRLIDVLPYSQPPSPSTGESGQKPKNQAAGHQHTAASDQPGTAERPLIVKILPSPDVDVATNQNTKEGDQKPPPKWWPISLWSTDNWLAVFTGGLVFVGVLQLIVFGRQARQLKRSVDAVERSDEVLERAYLWPGPGASEMEDDPAKPIRTRFFVTVHNTGRTAGVIKEVHGEICTQAQFNAGRIPPLIIRREDVIPPQMPLGQQKPTMAYCDLFGGAPQIMHGFIVYSDVFKKDRRCSWRHRVYPGGVTEPLDGCYSEWT